MAPPTMGWTLPHQSLIKKLPYRLAYSRVLWSYEGIFLLEVPLIEPKRGSLLLDDFHLRQVDVRQFSTLYKTI